MPDPFALEALLENIAHPTRKPANPQKSVSSTEENDAGNLPASYPQAPATYPQALDAPPPSRVDLRVMRVDAGKLPASGSNVQDEKNPDLAGLRVDSGMCAGELNPWHTLLAQVDTLTARLVELQAPRLRIDINGLARGYRSLEGLSPEGVTRLLGEMLSALAKQYPDPSGPVQIIALWPGKYPEPTRRVVVSEVQSDYQVVDL